MRKRTILQSGANVTFFELNRFMVWQKATKRRILYLETKQNRTKIVQHLRTQKQKNL